MRNFSLWAGLAFLFLFSSNTFAQQKKFKGVPGFDFRIGYGITPVQNLNNSFSTELIPDLADDKYVTLKKEGTGMFSASASFQTAGHWGFGIDAVYGKTKAVFTYPNTSSQEPESKWFTVMANVRYTYFVNLIQVPNIQLYGSIAAGSSFRDAQVEKSGSTKTFNQNYFAYQITPFGIRTGQKIAFWAELGYGFKGLLNAGLSLQF
jgi:hypothetical protein